MRKLEKLGPVIRMERTRFGEDILDSTAGSRR
jgi:hypothetical protein